VFLNPSMSAALDRITERAADVRRAFTPGALPQHNDVAASLQRSDFTLDPLSVALPDGAYFMTTDARGRTVYARDGTFAIAGARLVDARGNAVLGRRMPPGGPLSDLRVDSVDATLGRAANVRVEADGSLVYTRAAIDPRTGKRVASDVVVGRIALARFPAGTKLDTVDGGSFFAPHGVAPHTGVAGDGVFGTLVPMRRERSRVDLDASLLRLKDAYVAFDALAAAETAKDHFSKAAMDVVK
jgi:flagellar basal body rod protein FlgG